MLCSVYLASDRENEHLQEAHLDKESDLSTVASVY